MKFQIYAIVGLVVCTVILFCCRPRRAQEVNAGAAPDEFFQPGTGSIAVVDNHIYVKEKGPTNWFVVAPVAPTTVDADGNMVISWNPDGQAENDLVSSMTNAVPGITRDEARKLILARARWNWKYAPAGNSGPDLQAIFAFQLKDEISKITTNIADVLNVNIGDVRRPPLMDAVLRESIGQEIEAILKNQ